MKNETNVDPYVKWDNTCIKVLSKEHGAKVIEFWKSVGVNTMFFVGDQCYYYYGIFDGIFNNWSDERHLKNKRILTLEEAIAIRNAEPKTFPREMYVWDNDISSIEKQMVYFIIGKSFETDERVIVVEDKQTLAFKNAMEVEEYEAMNKNKEILDEISNTKKQMNELNDKLSKLQDKLKY